MTPGTTVRVSWPMAPDYGKEGKVVAPRSGNERWLIWVELLLEDGKVHTIGFPKKSLTIVETPSEV